MKSYRWNVYLLALGGFLAGTSEFVIAGILDAIAADEGVSLSAAGQLVTVFSLVFAFGTPVLVAATSRIERKRLLVATLLVFAAGNLLPFVVRDIVSLLASRVVLALCSGVFTVAAITLAAHLAPAERKGSAIATIVMGFSSSLVIGVPLGRTIAALLDWHDLFLGVGVGAIVVAFVIAQRVPELEGQAPVALRTQLAVLRNRGFASGLLVTFFWIAGYSAVYTYVSPFLLDHMQMPPYWVSAGLFAFGVCSLIGSRLGGYGADKWGTPATLTSSLLLHACVLLSFAVMQPPLIVVLILMMLWSVSAWATAPVQQLRLISLAPGASDIALSLNTSVLQAGMAAGAALGGAVVSRLPVAAVGSVGAACVLIGCAVALYSLRTEDWRRSTAARS